MNASNTHRCRACGRDSPGDVPECLDCRATDARPPNPLTLTDGQAVFSYPVLEPYVRRHRPEWVIA